MSFLRALIGQKAGTRANPTWVRLMAAARTLIESQIVPESADKYYRNSGADDAGSRVIPFSAIF
jgi:hypothetical protein